MAPAPHEPILLVFVRVKAASHWAYCAHRPHGFLLPFFVIKVKQSSHKIVGEVIKNNESINNKKRYTFPSELLFLVIPGILFGR